MSDTVYKVSLDTIQLALSTYTNKTLADILSNYYTQSQVYSKNEIKSLISTGSSDALSLASSDSDGLMSKEDYIKLDSIELASLLTTDTLQSKLLDYALSSDIPQNISDLINDSGFITDATTALTNYYTKTQSYSKDEIDNLVTGLTQGVNWKASVESTDDLPTDDCESGDARVVISEECIYIWNGTEWVAIGSSAIVNLATSSLNGLMSMEDKAKLDSIILDELVTNENLTTILADYAKSSDIPDVHTFENQDLLDTITNSGDGTKYLSDDGTYKTISTDSEINDTEVGADTTYSSEMIEKTYAKKSIASTYTLSASDWSDGQYTLELSDTDDDYFVEQVYGGTDYTDGGTYDVYCDAQIVMTESSTSTTSIVLVARGDIPTVDIPIKIMIRW